MRKPKRPLDYDVPTRILQKLLSRLEFEPNTGCWLWPGAWDHEYGKIGWGRKSPLFVHRVVYTALRRPLLPDELLDHRCRVRCCCNPDHLRVVDQRTNVLENSLSPVAANVGKTHCPRGHEYTEENTYRRPDAPHHRDCLMCRTARNRAQIPKTRERRAKARALRCETV